MQLLFSFFVFSSLSERAIHSGFCHFITGNKWRSRRAGTELGSIMVSYLVEFNIQCRLASLGKVLATDFISQHYHWIHHTEADGSLGWCTKGLSQRQHAVLPVLTTYFLSNLSWHSLVRKTVNDATRHKDLGITIVKMLHGENRTIFS